MFTAFVEEFGDASLKKPLCAHIDDINCNHKYLIFSAFIVKTSELDVLSTVHTSIADDVNYFPEDGLMEWEKLSNRLDKKAIVNEMSKICCWNTSAVIDKSHIASYRDEQPTFYQEVFEQIVSEVAIACRSISDSINEEDASFELLVFNKPDSAVYENIYSKLLMNSVLSPIRDQLMGNMPGNDGAIDVNSSDEDSFFPPEILFPVPTKIENHQTDTKYKCGFLFSNIILSLVSEVYYLKKYAPKDYKYIFMIKNNFPNPFNHNGINFKLGIRVIGRCDKNYYLPSKMHQNNLYKRYKRDDKNLDEINFQKFIEYDLV